MEFKTDSCINCSLKPDYIFYPNEYRRIKLQSTSQKFIDILRIVIFFRVRNEKNRCVYMLLKQKI